MGKGIYKCLSCYSRVLDFLIVIRFGIELSFEFKLLLKFVWVVLCFFIIYGFGNLLFLCEYRDVFLFSLMYVCFCSIFFIFVSFLVLYWGVFIGIVLWKREKLI